MKLDPPSRRKVRVHELAKELGWTSRQLLDELGRRGEFVKSASSTLEPPVVCEIRREFASVDDMLDPDVTVAPEAYGKSAYPRAAEVPDESFGAEYRRAKSRSAQRDTQPGVPRWRSTILQFILDEVIVRRRREHLHRSQGSYFRWELKQAEEMNASWAEARLNGLDCDETEAIEWIRLSEGDRPRLAAELFGAGLSPEEVQLRLGYGGRIDPRRPTLYQRFRDGHISRTEVVAAVREWHRRNAAE